MIYSKKNKSFQSVVEAIQQIHSPFSGIEHNTPTRNEVIPNVDDEIATTDSAFSQSSPESLAVVNLLPGLSSTSRSNVCDIQSNDNISADLQLLSDMRPVLTNAVAYNNKAQPLEVRNQ